jgi:pimeloyl-ACP methyl ester carboxylesterase
MMVLSRCAVVAVVLLGSGCFAGVSLKPVRTDVSFRKLQGNALSSDGPSIHTAQLLRLYNLQDSYAGDMPRALELLRDEAFALKDRSVVFGLAELACYYGRRMEKRQPDQALALYCSAARYAYFYLFDEEFGAPPDPFDPRFRMACDLYNFSVARAIRLMQAAGYTLADLEFEVPLWDGSMEVRIELHGFLPEQIIDRVLLATEYDVRGVRNQYRTFGLGVPLIALGPTPPKESHLPETPSYPATAFLRIEGGVNDTSPAVATFQLYDPTHIQSVQVDNYPVPLESDITTPLGFLLANPELERSAYIGLLRAERVEGKSGLYMLEPYQPDKIPVVMIHGLVSSPLTWAEMLNDLRGQPNLRERFQFWFYQYPTAYPFAYPASQLRRALLDVRDTFDPEHDDAAFDEMVLIGHSMGGLLSKMMVQDSGDTLWDAVSRKPMDDLDLTPEEEQLIQDVFFFEPLPFVSRVIFVATPHRGSSLSDGPIATLVTLLIAVPKAILMPTIDFLDRNPDAMKEEFKKRRLTSVDNLSPSNPMIEALMEIPIAPGVTYHSIVGNIADESDEEMTDGVVPYASSHLEGAASERIVPAWHSAHYHPLAILEVRRILQEHLVQAPQPSSP